MTNNSEKERVEGSEGVIEGLIEIVKLQQEIIGTLVYGFERRRLSAYAYSDLHDKRRKVYDMIKVLETKYHSQLKNK